jgi:hypothetical protein
MIVLPAFNSHFQLQAVIEVKYFSQMIHFVHCLCRGVVTTLGRKASHCFL